MLDCPGTLLVTAISMISILISWRFKSSKNSIMTMLMIVLIILAPSLFFGTSLKKTDFGFALENINPASHAMNSLDSVLVDNERTLVQQISHIGPVIAFTLICTFIFIVFTRKFEVKSAE